MSRKNKGAALFELLHRDKGKSTTADGSLKMPSWFHSKSQPTAAAKPDQPVKLAAQPVANDRQLDEVLDTTTPPESVPAEQPTDDAPPPAEVVDRPAGQSSVSTSSPRPVPAMAPAPSAGPTSAPPRLVPPWATGPWLQTTNGRVRVNVTRFAAYIGLGVAGCVLIIAFSLGRMTVRPASVPPQAEPAHGEVDQAMNDRPNPGVTDVGNTGGSNPTPIAANLANGGSTGNVGTGAANTNTGPVQNLPPGNNYVIVLTGQNKDECDKICSRLRQMGFDMVVASQQGRNFQIRTKIGTDVATAKQICQQLAVAKDQLFSEQPNLLRGYKPNDPNHKPYVRPF